MSGRTHFVIGAQAAWVVWWIWEIPTPHVLAAAFAGAIGALLPDIDASHALAHRMGGGVLGAFRGAFTHRGFFHSLLAVAVLGAIAGWALIAWESVFLIACTVGYASHLLIDGCNYKGTQYLFPWPRRFHLVPKWLASPIGGVADHCFFLSGVLALLWLLVRIAPSLSATGFPMIQE